MANAVFTTKVKPVYDDLPEVKYHFPKTYLNQVEAAIGDLIIYYEPRREDARLSGRSGRQVYFATARVDRVESDPKHAGQFYAYVSNYLEFPNQVPFKKGSYYFESGLQKLDGTTNKGRFGRSVRVIPPIDFQAILAAGFADQTPETKSGWVAEDTPAFGRPLKTVISERPFREVAFSRVIRSVYGLRCSMTGLHLTDGARSEVEAAHIRPVSEQGPDSPRNGIALSRTIHWMFDRGILSINDDGKILKADRLVPPEIRGILNPNGHVTWPSDPLLRPHKQFLRYHRETLYKGN